MSRNWRMVPRFTSAPTRTPAYPIRFHRPDFLKHRKAWRRSSKSGHEMGGLTSWADAVGRRRITSGLLRTWSKIFHRDNVGALLRSARQAKVETEKAGASQKRPYISRASNH